jgi:hypothetical protein
VAIALVISGCTDLPDLPIWRQFGLYRPSDSSAYPAYYPPQQTPRPTSTPYALPTAPATPTPLLTPMPVPTIDPTPMPTSAAPTPVPYLENWKLVVNSQWVIVFSFNIANSRISGMATEETGNKRKLRLFGTEESLGSDKSKLTVNLFPDVDGQTYSTGQFDLVLDRSAKTLSGQAPQYGPDAWVYQILDQPVVSLGSWPPGGTPVPTPVVSPSGGTASSATVTSVSPSSVAPGSTEAMTVTGTNFQTGATLVIDGMAATSVVVTSATQILANLPAGLTIGQKTVVVTNPGSAPVALTNGLNVQQAAVPASVTLAVNAVSHSIPFRSAAVASALQSNQTYTAVASGSPKSNPTHTIPILVRWIENNRDAVVVLKPGEQKTFVPWLTELTAFFVDQWPADNSGSMTLNLTGSGAAVATPATLLLNATNNCAIHSGIAASQDVAVGRTYRITASGQPMSNASHSMPVVIRWTEATEDRFAVLYSGDSVVASPTIPNISAFFVDTDASDNVGNMNLSIQGL